MSDFDREQIIELLKPAVERYQSAPWSRETFLSDAEIIRRDRPTNSCVLRDSWIAIGRKPTEAEWSSVISEAWDRFAVAPEPAPSGNAERAALRERIIRAVEFYVRNNGLVEEVGDRDFAGIADAVLVVVERTT